MAETILNPKLPLVHELEGGLLPGKMVKVQGRVPSGASRFAINYQLGPGLNPRDDIAIHVSPRFREGFLTRNHIESMSWGPEENEGPMLISPGEPFEIIILCEYHCYKIAINGRHFTDFAHRLPIDKVTHLTIDGEVEVNSVFFEVIPIPMPSAPVPNVSPVNVGPPPPGGLYPTLNPDDKYRPPPDMCSYGNNAPTVYYPEPQKSEKGDAFMDKVGLAVGGLVAAGGVAAAMHAYNNSKKKNHSETKHEKTRSVESESLGGLGALGAALASSLASNAFQGDRNAHAQQGYPTQGGGMLGSILGSLGGKSGPQPNYEQPPVDPLGGALGSILGGVLGGGSSHQQQPQYQPSGGYGGISQNQGSQNSGSSGNDLLSGLGNALFKSTMDSLSKHSQRSHHNAPNSESGGHYAAPAPPPPSYEVPRVPRSPPTSGGPKLSAAEISKGLGLGDDED